MALGWFDERADRLSMHRWAIGVIAQIRYRPGFQLSVDPSVSMQALMLRVQTFVADADAEKAETEVELPLFDGLVPLSDDGLGPPPIPVTVPVKLFRQIRLMSSSVIPHMLLANRDEAGLVRWVYQSTILELEKHEAAEWFRYQGRKVYDPHAGEGRTLMITEVDREKKVVTFDAVCDCDHPLGKHREGEEGGEQDEVVLCDAPGCLCPGFQEKKA